MLISRYLLYIKQGLCIGGHILVLDIVSAVPDFYFRKSAVDPKGDDKNPPPTVNIPDPLTSHTISFVPCTSCLPQSCLSICHRIHSSTHPLWLLVPSLYRYFSLMLLVTVQSADQVFSSPAT